MKPKKLLSLILSMLMLAVPLASCSKDETIETDPHSGEVVETAKTELLTHIFRGEDISLPKDYSLMDSITPIYDSETGNITCFCRYGYEVTDEEGNYVDYISENHIVTVASDGTVVNDLKLENEGEENTYINNGVLTSDSLIYLNSSYDRDTGTESYYLAKYNFADGSVTKSDSLQPLFAENENSRPWFYINAIQVDNEGFIYLAAEQEVVVLDPNFIKSFSIFSSGWINTMSVAPDGTVYVSGYFDNGNALCPIDKTTKALGTPVSGLDSLGDLLFGDGYDFYYTTNDGLYGLTMADTAAGETENKSELIMSYGNSDITRYDITIMKIIDNETLIVSEQDPETYNYHLSLYKKAPDLDLSTVKVIDIATTYTLYNQIPEMIVSYNKEHPESRIIVTDYSKYNTDEDYGAGETKLTTDILNGLYKPDIVIDNTNTRVISEIIENDLYTDLNTFIDKDDTITRDDIFGSVLRTFDDDGKMWGITNSFSIRTLIGRTDVLGDRESWTFTEMLDFAATLPEGVDLTADMTQTSAAYTIFSGSGYGAFIDSETNTAHFDSPEFIKYLNFIATLPKEINYEARPDDYWDTRYLRYHNGEIVLSSETIYSPGEWIGLEASFNTKDFTVIGYPTANAGEYGSTIQPDYAYIITSFTEYPEEAWNFIKSLCVPEFDEDRGGYGGVMHSFPILKSMYDKMIEEYYTYEYEFYFSGGASWGSYDPENPDTSEMREPGIRTYFTEDDAAKLKDFLDNKAGASISSAISDEITAIVDEEISSFTSGVRSAEATADIIQSRVSIWLAEHE